MVTYRTLSLVMLLAAVNAAAQPTPTTSSLLKPPSDWGAYYSGGPYRAGTTVTLPDGRKGVVVGDFRETPNGTASRSNPGHYRYSVMVPAKGPVDATKDCPDFGLSIVTLELVGGRASVTGGADAEKMIAEYQKRLGDYRQRVFSATADGRALQDKADKMFAKWNERNDRSVKKFTTAEGYTSLLTDMALAGTADKFKKGLKTNGDLDKIFKEALVDAAKEKLSGDLPLNAPGTTSNTAATAELTKGNIKAILTQKLKDVPENGRAEVMTKLIVQFGALAMDKGGEEDLSELALEALADVAVDVGLSRYPIAGPLAKEAVELAKQYRGYLMTIEKLAEADANFTKALNAFNDSYGARQSLALMQKHKKELMKQASDALYAEDAKLEDWLVGRVADGLEREQKLFADLAAKFPVTDVRMGPPAPADAKKPLVIVRDAELDGALDTWRIPSLIENAGHELAVVEFDRLNLGGKKFVPKPGIGGLRRYDGGEMLGFGSRDSRDFVGDMRRIFSGPGPFGRGPSLELVPPEPPKPTLDEKQMLERDCRLKRMAQAEKLVPRIGPQARKELGMRSMFKDLPDVGGTPGLNVRRFSDTKVPRVIRLYDTKEATGAGILRR